VIFVFKKCFYFMIKKKVFLIIGIEYDTEKVKCFDLMSKTIHVGK
jgi:hypothetical protein